MHFPTVAIDGTWIGQISLAAPRNTAASRSGVSVQPPGGTGAPVASPLVGGSQRTAGWSTSPGSETRFDGVAHRSVTTRACDSGDEVLQCS